VEHVEIRWRNAALAEAKAVVVAHQNAADPEAKRYQFPRLYPPLIQQTRRWRTERSVGIKGTAGTLTPATAFLAEVVLWG
jgi:hypothetical protein